MNRSIDDYEFDSSDNFIGNKNKPPSPPPLLESNTSFNTPLENTKTKLKRDNFGITSGQDADNEWGKYARYFDEVVSSAGGRVDKREVAVSIGLSVTSDTFRKLLNRRKTEGKVRAYRGSHYLIEWINRDYQITALGGPVSASFLDIRLSLGIHDLVKVPPRSVIGVAGMTSSGKTSYLLETAELNCLAQDLPVYYWYNEMGEEKLRYRCEDFPALTEAYQRGQFKPAMQTNFEFADVLQPDAINIIDYLDRDDNLFLIGEDIKALYRNLGKGVIVFAIQKKEAVSAGYGGLMSKKLSNVYITLDEKFQSGQSTHGIAKITKAKDWVNMGVNPVGLKCAYHTGGKHGKLLRDGEWTK